MIHNIIKVQLFNMINSRIGFSFVWRVKTYCHFYNLPPKAQTNNRNVDRSLIFTGNIKVMENGSYRGGGLYPECSINSSCISLSEFLRHILCIFAWGVLICEPYINREIRASPSPRPMRPGPWALPNMSKFGALQNILVLGLNRSFFRAERPKVYSNPSTESWFGPLLFENK